MHLDDYLDAASRRPWIYGGGHDGWQGHDCTLFLANWAHSFGRGDPGVYRGTYATKEEAVAIIERARGLVPLIMTALVNVGWRGRDGDPQDGDIGVVVCDGIDVGAIRRGRRWIIADEHQLAHLPGNLFIRTVWHP
ncbi:MAG: hypothetical protein J0I98_06490 [Mesorhizobium sp.]|nr:hypothetical protein [Mesorhizobium sp.]MBN9242424.1 hypothetical protein [Mesorhizobium sp.]